MTAASLAFRAVGLTSEFIDRAGSSLTAKEAAEWALAARNMASTVHSLAGADVMQTRRAERRVDARERGAAR